MSRRKSDLFSRSETSKKNFQQSKSLDPCGKSVRRVSKIHPEHEKEANSSNSSDSFDEDI